jgi:TetR/AcrR family transcriptional repressor of nem operon
MSRSHRDQPGTGCAVAALGPEATRHGKEVRRAFSDSTVSLIDVMAKVSDGATDEARREDAIATIAAMLGAIVLSRVVEDPALSDRLLAVTRKRLMKPS